MLVAILIFLPHRFSVGLELGKDSPKSKTLIFLFVPWARSSALLVILGQSLSAPCFWGFLSVFQRPKEMA